MQSLGLSAGGRGGLVVLISLTVVSYRTLLLQTRSER